MHDEIEAIRADLRAHAEHRLGDSSFQARTELRLDTLEKRAGRQTALITGLTLAAASSTFAFLLSLFGG